ncbi:HP0268 family nuclease [Campylobacter sp.]|uniref:HP0268 family nuclease n=1 Tax=Campylobacter sp. TaxID=205 RepID=UPI0026DC2347|nr:HP0268 family nuclease [Campylobacter sp.]MDO4674240.1 HP0268 family nuclease [Campylobacter sp.]
MDLKLARNLTNEKPKTISLGKIEDAVDKEGQKFFYFDKDNSHKQLIALVEHFEKKGLNVYHRVVKYGLDEQDYMYEVHIL